MGFRIRGIWVIAYSRCKAQASLSGMGGAVLKPIVVFGIPDSMIRLWDVMPGIEVMINNIRWRWGRPSVSRIWVDSGGYQIMVKGMSIDVKDVIKRYRDIDGDIYVSLDVPPQSLCNASKELVDQNVRNFEMIYARLEDKKIVPVVHCYESKLLLHSIDVYRSYGVDIIAYGGAVPPSMARMGKGSRTIPLIALAIVRKAFSRWIHALGIGGTPAIYRALTVLGVNSLDSTSWRTKAAYGKVMIPGLGERYVGNGSARFGRKDLTEEDFEALERALKETGFPYVDSLADLLRIFRGRALVNAWIMRYYIDTIYSNNGFSWIIKYASKYSSLSLTELSIMLDRKLKSLRRHG